MRVLFIGDVVGRGGRQLVREFLPALRRDREVDFVVANAENAAGGKGLTRPVADELFDAGVDALTGGNHTWRNKGVFDLVDSDPRVLRPANHPAGAAVPGRGDGAYDVGGTGRRVGVVNVQGLAFMDPVLACPLRVARASAERLREQTPIIIVDIHAEATSEKIALGWYLDGLVTAVIGTHTHVPTADETVTAAGTAMQTDAGMTGSFDGVLGVRKDLILHALLTGMPVRHELSKGDLRLCGTLIEADADTGRAQGIERICLRLPS